MTWADDPSHRIVINESFTLIDGDDLNSIHIVCKIERSNLNRKKILSFAQKSDAIKKTQMANVNRYPSVIYGLCWFHSFF